MLNKNGDCEVDKHFWAQAAKAGDTRNSQPWLRYQTLELGGDYISKQILAQNEILLQSWWERQMERLEVK